MAICKDFFFHCYSNESLFPPQKHCEKFVVATYMKLQSQVKEIRSCINVQIILRFPPSICPVFHLVLYMFLSVLRFRAGFKRVFRWCPFVRVSDYDELELRAMRHKVARQSSMYTLSRIETTVVAVCDPSEPTSHPGRKSLHNHQHNGCSNPTKSKEVMQSDLKEEFC